MTQPPAGPAWTAMPYSDFDANAPAVLPFSSGPKRIYANADSFGTEALFGDTPPPKKERTKQATPDPGQEGLF
ncbi:hypothetical protein OTB20_25185 [Streptomyces sp. H27-H1]|uniref:hypothetical protein n=1 Tax=unclassified Streptomyces TaxID=2593676 RepID=UPI00227025A6|nr:MULTISPECIES: hypothetical protein [unclassified Streptomyces]MCY0929433.1 hypothetical protein [Streptomyces sp. H27-H1]MCY0938351.1 hypothetical protein [Streptomyces sp. H34-S4]